YSSELNCPYCGTQLTGYEIEYIQQGTSVRCRRCGTILSKDQFQTTGANLQEHPISPQATESPWQQPSSPPPQKGNGAIIFFIGFVVFSLGLYSWIFYIPIFDLTYYGEILGAIAVVIGLSNLRKEVANPSAIMIMAAGVFLWIAAWLSWIIYIPILTEGFIGEFGGLGLIIFGYLKSR
ncbi:MAG: DUF3953 domain-containing protein, partial [Candidatus Thorarchaeota archaeon]